MRRSHTKIRLSGIPEGHWRMGYGYLSGGLSVLFGLISLMLVVAYSWPALFTTPQFQVIAKWGMVRPMIATAMISAGGLALWNMVRGLKPRLAIVGTVLAGIAMKLGGPSVSAPLEQGAIWIGFDWFVIGLLTTAPLFILLEKLTALRRNQPVFRAKWALDFGYFFINHLMLGVFAFVATWVASDVFAFARVQAIVSFVQDLPIVLQVLGLVVVVDLAEYWVHRIYHESPLFWRFHAVHHSAETMDWLAGSRLHILEPLVTRSLLLVPMIALGFEPLAVGIYVTYVGFHSTFIHANCRWTFGPLEKVFVTPKMHHWHHAKAEEAINVNYAAHFAIYDRIFGTFHNPAEWPESYGVMEDDVPQNFIGQVLHPFRD